MRTSLKGQHNGNFWHFTSGFFSWWVKKKIPKTIPSTTLSSCFVAWHTWYFLFLVCLTKRKLPNCLVAMKPQEVCLLWKNGRTALGARRTSGAVCFGRTGGVVCSGCTALGWGVCFGRTALEWSSLLWVLRSCALTLRMFFIMLGSQLWLSTFCHQSKTFTAFVYFIFPPSSNLKTPSHVCKIFRLSRIFFQIFWGQSACSILLGAWRTALGTRRTAHEFSAFGFIATRPNCFSFSSFCLYLCKTKLQPTFLFLATKPYLKLFGVQTNGHGTTLINKACLTPWLLLERKNTLRKLKLTLNVEQMLYWTRNKKKVTILCFQL